MAAAQATRRAVLAGLALPGFVLAGVVLAGLALAPVVARGQGAGPSAPIAALDEALLAAMKAGRATPFRQRADALAPVVERAFALEAILALSVGPRYASLAAQDRADLLAAFREYTVASYVANFDTYAGERFEIAPQTRAAGADQVVQTRILPASGAATRLDYVMRGGPAGWQAVDVLVDGSISRVAVQRSDFRSLLAAGSAGPLIASLRAKTNRLASGDKS